MLSSTASAGILDCQVAVFLPAGDGAALHGATPGFILGESERERAIAILHGAESTDEHTPDASPRMLALTSVCCIIGVIAVRMDSNAALLAGEQADLLQAFTSQAAVAIERAQLAEDARQAYLDRETQKLQTALLNSISHDLRTPLASVTGSLSTLLDSEVTLDKAARRGLIETAYAEAQRLNHLVGNLLDMSRLQAGAMRAVREPCDLQDLIGAALEQLGERLRYRKVAVDAPVLPMVPMDFGLMTQVLVNLLDNALKYSPPDNPVEVNVREEDSVVYIEVADHGAGISAEDLPYVFDSFYCLRHPGSVHGTGLGLSISRGIVELHGGRLKAANRPGGGAVFTVELPQPQPVATEAQA